LLTLRADPPVGGPAALRETADREADRCAQGLLARFAPGDVVLSEEAPEDPRRHESDRVWIVDPLDGTREFGETGRTDWAVHIALWARDGSGVATPERGGDLVAGAVALPAAVRVLDSATTPRAAAGPVRRSPVVVASRSRTPAAARLLAAHLGSELLLLGSVGAKVAAVVTGRADAYLETGGLHEWDSAAPAALARAAGLSVLAPDGSRPAWNRPSTWQAGLIVCRAELVPAALRAVRDAAG